MVVLLIYIMRDDAATARLYQTLVLYKSTP